MLLLLGGGIMNKEGIKEKKRISLLMRLFFLKIHIIEKTYLKFNS
jgi:hypothetical protein